jgi:DNA-binding MarR family transcriptional regulator
MSTRASPARDELPVAVSRAVGQECLCLHVQRAARALARRFDEALRPFALTHGQFSLLMSLNRAEPAGMARVSAALAMDRTTLTANLKPLERRGLARAAVDPADRRGRLILVTPKGKKLLKSALPAWRRAHAGVDRLLGQSDPERLRRDLRALA